MTDERYTRNQSQPERRRIQSLTDRLPPLTERDKEEARVVWWRQVRLGHRLPAERGVIVVDGEQR